MKEFQAFKDTLSNKALKAIYEESKIRYNPCRKTGIFLMRIRSDALYLCFKVESVVWLIVITSSP